MNDHSTDSVSNKMEETLAVIRQVNEQLKDPVCISEFLIFLMNNLRSQSEVLKSTNIKILYRQI